MVNTKFLMTLDRGVYSDLGHIAQKEGITVQELMRARIISDWLSENANKFSIKRNTK